MAAEIMMYGVILNDDQVAGIDARELKGVVTPLMIQDSLDEAKGQDIDLRVNSSGGAAQAGFAIANSLARHGGRVTARIDSLAASSAMNAITGADRVEMADNAGMLIHSAMIGMLGMFNAGDLREHLDIVENLNDRTATSLARRGRMNAKQWGEILATGRDYVLNARQARRLGLVNEVVKPSSATQGVKNELQSVAADSPELAAKMVARWNEATQWEDPEEKPTPDPIAPDIAAAVAEQQHDDDLLLLSLHLDGPG